MIALAVMLLAIVPAGAGLVEDRVDLIEVNHFYDENGKLIFEQVLYYEWSKIDDRFHVLAWRLLTSDNQEPRWDSRRRRWVATWHDGSVLRRVTSPIFRESWTQYDPELVEREHLPKEDRRGLTPAEQRSLIDE